MDRIAGAGYMRSTVNYRQVTDYQVYLTIMVEGSQFIPFRQKTHLKELP